MYGWTGDILVIDLTKKSIEIETPGLDILNQYIGGKGFGGRYLRQCATLACRREITGLDYTPDTLLSLLEKIALGKGEGKDLALGATCYAKKMGLPQLPQR